MATVTTATAGIAGEIRQSYDTALLLAARPELVHTQFANKRPIPKGQGNTINLRRFELLTAATTALTEGVTPSGSSLVVSNVAIAVQQYGDFVQLSDKVTWTSIDPMVSETVRLQGQQAGNTLDQLARDVFVTGTTVRYANGRVSRVTVQAGDIMTGTEIKKAVRTLKVNNAKRINGHYVAIVHPNTSYDIQGISEWLAVKEYSDREDLYNGELGRLYGVRFVETTNAKIFTAAGAAGADVYGTLFFGADAFGSSEISGEAMETISKPLGSGGATDPLNQRQTQGWKATWGSAVLNDLFVCRLEHGVTA
jgi:N4-gp56 family major capsid protein